jgi:tRNA uridine 5-carboxymethylaminomethyl modification enzyme
LVHQKEPLILDRSEAYIGVLIDDLVTKGTDEPYRMFTSRAEYRILLRQDNADLRLTPLSNRIGLASAERLKRVEEKVNAANEIVKYFKEESVDPLEMNPLLEEKDSALLNQKVKLFSVLSRPGISLPEIRQRIQKVSIDLLSFEDEFVEQAEILMKYEGYIKREKDQADKTKRLENVKLPANLEYQLMTSLSAEARQKLSSVQPQTLGQAARISGVSPSDISVLMVYIGR